jgi:hypothetical protein
MNPPITQLSDADQARLEQMLLEFDQHWTPRHLGVMTGQFATESPEFRLAALTQIAKIDLDQRWSQGEQARLETYIERFEELRDSEAVLRELLQAEVEVRRLYDAIPTEVELQQRIPSLGDEVSKLLAEVEATAQVPRSGGLGDLNRSTNPATRLPIRPLRSRQPNKRHCRRLRKDPRPRMKRSRPASNSAAIVC